MSRYRKRYIKHHGEVPEGWVIHHIDGDRRNGDIENLIAVSQELHTLIHRHYSKKVKLLEENEAGTLVPKGNQLPDRTKIQELEKDLAACSGTMKMSKLAELEFRMASR